MSQEKQPGYTRHFKHSLDDRNRITIPADWRFTHDADDVLLAVPQTGKNGPYISILPKPEAAKLRAKIEQIALSDDAGQDFAATYFSETQQLWFDKAGRISLTPELLAHAGITSGEENVILVGALTKFHVYNPAVWAETKSSAAKEKGETMRRLGI